MTGTKEESYCIEDFPADTREKSSIRITVLRSSDFKSSILGNNEEDIKMALAPECSRTFPTSVLEKSGSMGTATAPMNVIAKKATPQFGILELSNATLSPGSIPFFSRNAITD